MTVKQMRDLLVGAFEGGSNYWYMIERTKLRPGLKIEDFHNGGKMQPKDDYYHWSQLVPTTRGCALIITCDDDKQEYKLNLTQLKIGECIMRTKYPEHYADVLAENDDSITADVFLQCALLGEVVYG